MKIVLDAAKGLHYLHNTKTPVIFRDFKTSNILLDENFNAKLSDFGLAKDGPTGQVTHISATVKGTYEYAAPEYLKNGHLRVQVDTYALGMVLLLMLTGQRSVDMTRPSQQRYLVNYARKPLVQGKKAMRSIFDPRMECEYSSGTAAKIAELAYICLRDEHRMRPPMDHVVETLELVLARHKRV
ncbi:putative serine/threonine-protein kinase PBL8 [Bidens hawaiensis]|uniref:putative serine/threonine-protein kinase PBL8 n=1 Tax=Bidens hawaiensis TaxID=980011 RepID=UPI0040496E9E